MNVLDLFSGIGGISLGLERAGMRTIAFCEADPNARKVLAKHWPEVPIFDDVKTLSAKDIHGTIDVIAGGFPCQDLSVAGRGAGLEGARSGLWWEMHRLIKEIRPRYVIAENVAALRSRGLDTVLRSLAEIGYDAEWHCIPAAALGAPHSRDRIWIVAYPQLHGRAPSEIAGSTPEAVREESTGQDNALDPSRAGSVPAAAHHVADTERKGSQGRIRWWANSQREAELGYFGRCRAMDGQPIESQWHVEPDVGRVANGVPNRTHRLKQLGNAVVPQIPEMLAMAVNHWEAT